MITCTSHMKMLPQAHKNGFFAGVSKIGVLIFALTASTLAAAVPIDQISVGESYFVRNLLSANELVVVKGIDYSRELVKVQYPTGVIDWVSPTQLLGRTESENQEIGKVVVGTAVVAGALWAIFDPEGFERPIARSTGKDQAEQAQSPSKLYQTPVPIAAVPFSPVVEGDWIEKDSSWRDWSESVLRAELGKVVSIESVRSKHIPFYAAAGRNVALIEAVETGRLGAYYVLAVIGTEAGGVVLDGTGRPIHDLNKSLGLSIESSRDARAYLKFFTSAISAEDGIFLVLDKDGSALSTASLERIGVNPMQVRQTQAGDWTIFADVIYGNDVYEAELLVGRDGYVDMVNDSHKARLSYQYQVVMDGGRRIYVKR